MSAGLRISHDDGVLHVLLDRPEKRNAIDDAMFAGLLDAIAGASTDDGVRVIVLEGAGGNFCGGADIVARNTPDSSGGSVKPRVGSIQRRLPGSAHRLIPLIARIQTPVVAKVRGWAAGIGFQLALVADFAVAAEDARFWEPFAARGFTPDSGATWLLPRRVGEVRARELLLLGRTLTGTEAAAWGAIHQAVPESELDTVAGDLVAKLASGPTVALGLAKWLMHEGSGLALEQHLSNEAFAMELSSRTVDFREGLAAFKEKRPPHFEGR